jgi:hypothetical protein
MNASTPSPRRSVHHLLAMAVTMSAAALLATNTPSEAEGPHHGGSAGHSRATSGAHRSPAYSGPRDEHGRIARSESAKESFMRQSGGTRQARAPTRQSGASG